MWIGIVRYAVLTERTRQINNEKSDTQKFWLSLFVIFWGSIGLKST